MKESTPEIEELKRIPLSRIAVYLKARGWIEASDSTNVARWSRWNAFTGGMVELLLPIDKSIGDYDLRAADFLVTLSAFEGRTSQELVGELGGLRTHDSSARPTPSDNESSQVAPGTEESSPFEQFRQETIGRPLAMRPLSAKVVAFSLGIASLFMLISAVSLYVVGQKNVASGIRGQIFIAAGVVCVLVFLQVVLVAGFFVIAWPSLRRLIEERFLLLEVEMRGRMLSVLGYVMAEAAVDHESLDVRDRDKLADAIVFVQRGYELLRKVGGAAEMMALNNLVYYLSLMGDSVRRGFILEGARRLMAAGQENNAANLVLTACRAMLQFGVDLAERQAAREILASLANSSNSQREREEAKLCLATFDRQ